MIIIVNRDDLPPSQKHRTVESLKLYHLRLPVDAIQKADIIVFVDGEAIKFLRNVYGINSLQSVEALINYVKSAPQKQQSYPPMLERHLPRRRKDHGNLRRRKPNE